MRRALLLPFDHCMAAFARALPESPWLGLATLFIGCTVAWWIYVPLHELAHAFGCLATGGSVTRLEIDARYGAALLQQLFPFVAVGSDYAGQLTGFDTGGSDWVYLATDAAPFLLTVVVGVPLLVRLARRGRASAGSSFALGAALPVALAPFTNLPGDYYEMGSIVVTRAMAFVDPGFPLERWRSDDFFSLAGRLANDRLGPGDVAGLSASGLVGLVLALATYHAGAGVAALGERLRTAKGGTP
jgi:hypothetical protein